MSEKKLPLRQEDDPAEESVKASQSLDSLDPSSAAESDKAGDSKEKPVEVVTDLDGLPLRWFHVGGKVHLIVFEGEGHPIPACRWASSRSPFPKSPVGKGVGVSEEVARRGICKGCAKAGFHRVV